MMNKHKNCIRLILMVATEHGRLISHYHDVTHSLADSAYESKTLCSDGAYSP